MSGKLKITRPLVRYHGGKFRAAAWILPLFPPHRKYREPYCGGANILLQKPRVYSEIIGDLDNEVTTLFRVMQETSSSSELKRRLYYTPFARAEFHLAYESTEDPIEKSRRLIIRSFMGHSSAAHNKEHRSGFRGKAERSGTTPAHDWRNYPDCLDAIIERLRGVVVESIPALELIEKYDDVDALFYLDPPYVKSTRFLLDQTKCYVYEMTDDDHRELSRALHTVKGMVVLSGYPSNLYDLELYPDWHRIEKPVTANGAAGGVDRTEVIWMNAAASRARGQRSLFEQL